MTLETYRKVDVDFDLNEPYTISKNLEVGYDNGDVHINYGTFDLSGEMRTAMYIVWEGGFDADKDYHYRYTDADEAQLRAA